MKTVMMELQVMNSTLETKAAVAKLTERLEEFACIEHINRLKTELLPKIEQFATMIDGFHNDNTDVRECIRKFDKSISIKANKSQFSVLKEEFERSFVHIKNWDTVLGRVEAMKEELRGEARALDQKFDKFKQHELDNNDLKCEQLMKVKLVKYNKVYTEF